MTLLDYISDSDISQTKLASQIGVSQPTIHYIAHGTKSPSVSLAKRIEKATGGKVTAIELLGLKEENAA